MTDIETLEKGWQKQGDWWFFPTDSGLSHQRAHTRQQAEQRTTKAIFQHKRIADVWVINPRSDDDGIRLGFIHERKILEFHKP